MTTAFVTMASREYMPQFRVLLASIRKFHPLSPVILHTWGDPQIQSGDGVEVVRHVETTGMPLPTTTAREWTPSVLLRPTIIKHGLYFYDKIIFVGADTELFAPISVDEALQQYDLGIVPHLCCPLEPSDKFPVESSMYATGVCNSDLQLWQRTDNTEKILAWYEHRLNLHPELDQANGHYADQSLINQIPTLFGNCNIWRTKRCNVAWWNAIPYNLKWHSGQYITDGGALSLFHYSGFTPNDPAQMSRHQNRWRATGDLLKLYEEYGARLKANGQ